MKKICILMLNLVTAESYRNQVYSVFGNSFEIEIRSIHNYNKDDVRDVDLFLMHNNSILKEFNGQLDFPIGIPVVDITIDYCTNEINMLKKYDNGTRCVFISASEAFTNEGIMRLHQLGVYNIEWIPFPESKEWLPDADFLVTPGETQSIPGEAMEKYEVVDIGPRKVAPNVMVEIAKYFNMEYVFEWSNYKDYVGMFNEDIYRSKAVVEENMNLNRGIDALGTIVREGVIAINEFGKIICFNAKVAEFLDVIKEDAIGKTLWEYNENLFGEIQKILEQKGSMERLIKKYHQKTLEMNLYPLLEKGEYRGSIMLVNDRGGRGEEPGRKRKKFAYLGHQGKYQFSDIRGKTLAPYISKAKKMASTDASLLITGETGTGKELFASAIHNSSRRKEAPFVAVNCNAISDSLLESELFGYEDGAFTGAKKNGRTGLFEIANGGTIFLDEIEDMSFRMQSSLLRVIQEKEIMRVGGSQVIPVDVRIITASNVNLSKLKDTNEFRSDLYYRIATLQLKLPPIRQRTADIPEIIDAYIRQKKYRFVIEDILMDMLMEQRWEGNVRELTNCVEYFSCLDKDIITVDDMPDYLLEENECDDEDNGCEIQLTETQHFVLMELYKAYCDRTTVGRKKISRLAEENNLFISEQEIRTILKWMEERGIVCVSVGRGGTKLTSLGLSICRRGK